MSCSLAVRSGSVRREENASPVDGAGALASVGNTGGTPFSVDADVLNFTKYRLRSYELPVGKVYPWKVGCGYAIHEHTFSRISHSNMAAWEPELASRAEEGAFVHQRRHRHAPTGTQLARKSRNPTESQRREWESNAQRARSPAELRASRGPTSAPKCPEPRLTDDGACQLGATQRSPRDQLASALEDAIRSGRQSGDLALARMAHAWLGELLDELEPGGAEVTDLSEQRKRRGR